MDFFLSKLMPVFVYPLGLAVLLVVVGLALLGRWRRTGRAIIAAAIGALWVASTPVFAQWIFWQLERQYPATSLDMLPDAAVAIVVGGAIGQPIPPRVEADLLESVDRVVDAARLYRTGKVRAILVTGGNLPWQTSAVPEGELIALFLVELGVPRGVISVETESRNTFENAENAASILRARGWGDALLLTSAFHMPRALAVFRGEGVNATPAVSDVRTHFPFVESPLDFLPDASALNKTSDALKELIGLLVYRLQGRL